MNVSGGVVGSVLLDMQVLDPRTGAKTYKELFLVKDSLNMDATAVMRAQKENQTVNGAWEEDLENCLGC